MRWNGSVCLVTGASSGIGRAVALKMAARGATVIAVARRPERLAALIEELGGPPHSYVVCDVADLEQVRAMAAVVAGRTGHLDALVNNAGIPSGGLLSASTPEEVQNVVRTNLLGPIWCIQELGHLLENAPKASSSPMIVNLASMAGRVPVPGAGIYTATKFGLVGFTEAVWSEMRARGIAVMVVNPGFVHTEGFPMDSLLANPLTRGLVMNPATVAEALCVGMERGRTEVRVQAFWHPLYFVTVLMGPLRRRIADRIWKAVGSRINI